jgi:hypothetical protein
MKRVLAFCVLPITLLGVTPATAQLLTPSATSIPGFSLLSFLLGATPTVATPLNLTTRRLATKIEIIYNVTDYGAACNAVTGSGGYISGTDDTAAIQSVATMAATAGGATILIPGPDTVGHTGKCAINHPIFVGANNVTIAGEGKYASTLVAMNTYSVVPGSTPRGNDGQFAAMIDLDQTATPPPSGPSPAQPPLVNFTIRDLGVDPRAATSTGGTIVEAVSATVRALQYFTEKNVYFELGAPITFTDTTKAFVANIFDSLSFDPANASHDLMFSNVTCHNGVGCVQLRSEAGCAASESPVVDQVWNMRILNETDAVDLANIEDDRDVISVNYCSHSSSDTPQFYNILNSGQQIFIDPSVSSGAVNGFKIEASSLGQIRNVVYDNWQYQGSPNATYSSGSPRGSGATFAMEDLSKNGTSVLRDISVAHGHANFAAGMGLYPQAESGQSTNVTVNDLTFTNDMSAACILVPATQLPTMYDALHIRNVTCSPSPQATSTIGTANLRGIELTVTESTANGMQGSVDIENVTLHGYGIPISIYQNGGWKNVLVENAWWDAGTPVVDATTIWRDSAFNAHSFGVVAGACTGGTRFTNGVAVYSSTGAPTCTAPNGSLYLRSDGTAGARLYVTSGSGTWTAVPGV